MERDYGGSYVPFPGSEPLQRWRALIRRVPPSRSSGSLASAAVACDGLGHTSAIQEVFDSPTKRDLFHVRTAGKMRQMRPIRKDRWGRNTKDGRWRVLAAWGQLQLPAARHRSCGVPPTVLTSVNRAARNEEHVHRMTSSAFSACCLDAILVFLTPLDTPKPCQGSGPLSKKISAPLL